MKRALIILSLAQFCGLSHAEGVLEQPGQEQVKDKNDRISYSIGINVGRNVSAQKLSINNDYFLMGLKDGQANKFTFLNEEDVGTTIADLQKEMAQRQREEKMEKSAKNLAEGEKFLAANKKKKGVVTLPSGLQYRIINKGKGDSPTPNDMVSTHYRGKLLDGTEFDSSYSRGKPTTFPVKGVIPGWTEALQLMKPGAKWELFVPAKLAYGENGAGSLIAPNACLLFEIELLSIEKAKEQPVEEPALKE